LTPSYVIYQPAFVHDWNALNLHAYFFQIEVNEKFVKSHYLFLFPFQNTQATFSVSLQNVCFPDKLCIYQCHSCSKKKKDSELSALSIVMWQSPACYICEQKLKFSRDNGMDFTQDAVGLPWQQ